MASQVALHPTLSNPFVMGDLSRGVDSLCKAVGDLHELFEDGKILVLDNASLTHRDYFLDHPGKFYQDWIPPLFTSKIRRPIEPGHALEAICEDPVDMALFQSQVPGFEDSWRALLQDLFPRYSWDHLSFSYRFNHLQLGSLHLDVPDQAYEGHQFRWFVNLDRRPRILAVGPTIFELAQKYWIEKNLERFSKLPVHEFIGALRAETLDKTINRERELPRHYLTLDPGAMWLSHSSYVSHGIVYGRKTACLEGHISPASLLKPSRHFNSLVRALQAYGPLPERELERRAHAHPYASQ